MDTLTSFEKKDEKIVNRIVCYLNKTKITL